MHPKCSVSNLFGFGIFFEQYLMKPEFWDSPWQALFQRNTDYLSGRLGMSVFSEDKNVLASL